MSRGHDGSCHCGAIRLTIPHTPEEVTRCNCTLCTKLGTRWVYFRPDEVDILDDGLEAYVRTDLAEPGLATKRCRSCGTIVCWRAFDTAYARMGVNANLFDPAIMNALPVRQVDGREWNG